MKFKRKISLLLIFAVVCGIIFSIPAFAGSGTPGQILHMSGTARVTKDARMFSAPGTSKYAIFKERYSDTQPILTIPKDTVLTFDYLENDGDGDTWYHITSGAAKQGFVYTNYLSIISTTTYTYDASFEQLLLYFPTGYHTDLRLLHKKYPNFKFEPLYVGKTLDSCVNMQYSSSSVTGTKKYISITPKNADYFDPRAKLTENTYIQPEPGWTYASRTCIYNFMNPQNLLGEERVFCFANLSKNGTETVAGLRAVVNNTFLANGYGGKKDAYINDIMEAGNQSGVSPYAIAALIIIEQGVNGTSSLISGTYSGYEGYYNFFNFGAYGSTKDAIYKNGLSRAKTEDWNSRRASIIGGAKLWGNNYINRGQNSFYLMNFDLANASHQYATNVQDALGKASKLYSVFKNNPSSHLTITIPVYSEFYQKPFPDVNMGQWYTDAVKYVKEKGVFSGFSDGMFRPMANISRQDFVVALSRCSGEDLSAYANETVPLKDAVKGTYYYSAVAWAYKKGVVKGYDSGYFGIGDKITREQVITFLYRYCKDYLKQDIKIPPNYSVLEKDYKDFANISAYAKDAVVWALLSGVIKGKANGTLVAPRDNCTRAEIAAIFYNCIENGVITLK